MAVEFSWSPILEHRLQQHQPQTIHLSCLRSAGECSENSLGMNGSRVLVKSNLEASAAAAANRSSFLSQVSTVANQKKDSKIEHKKWRGAVSDFCLKSPLNLPQPFQILSHFANLKSRLSEWLLARVKVERKWLQLGCKKAAEFFSKAKPHLSQAPLKHK